MGDQRFLEDRFYFSDKTSQAWQLRVHYHYCVFILIISPPPREAERQFRTLLSVQPGLLSRGATQQKNCMDAWLKQQAWDPLPRLQLLVSQQETVIFYTEPTGLSTLCCWVAGALQQGLLWFQVAFWNREPHQKLQNPNEISHILHLIQALA